MFLQTPGTGPQLGRMLGVAGGGYSRVQQGQGVAVITGIPEQRMQINTLMNFYLQQFDTLLDDTRKQNCDEKRNRKQYRVRKF